MSVVLENRYYVNNSMNKNMCIYTKGLMDTIEKSPEFRKIDIAKVYKAVDLT